MENLTSMLDMQHTVGVPQGFVFGSILYNVCTKELKTIFLSLYTFVE